MVFARPVPMQSGFTLIEVLIAITITAILGVGAVMTLDQGIKSKDYVEKRSLLLSELQKSQRILEQDLSQIVTRSVRSEYGDRQYAISNLDALNLMEFTRTGWRDPETFLASLLPEAEVKLKSNLQRVVYELEDDILYRRYWSVLDRAPDSEAKRQRILAGVKELELRFLDTESKWSDQWPTLVMLDDETLDGFRAVPKAIEIRLGHQTFGEIRRIIPLAGWDLATIAEPSYEAEEESEDAPASGTQSGTSQADEANSPEESP